MIKMLEIFCRNFSGSFTKHTLETSASINKLHQRTHVSFASHATNRSWKQRELISRKICWVVNHWNYHTVLHNAQCEKLAIFLSLWYYVKSMLADFRGSKTAILTILAAMNFEYLESFDIFKCEISKKSKFIPSKIAKLAILLPLWSLVKSILADFRRSKLQF